MRTIHELRSSMIQLLRGMTERPGMYGIGAGLEAFLRHTISQLSFIDENEDALSRLMDDLQARGLSGATGVYGRLREALTGVSNVEDEIASVYADVASRLGYLELDRCLTPDEWTTLDRWFGSPLDRDWRCSEIQGLFGPPSFSTKGCWRQVHCYASDERSRGWLCFDYGNEARSWNDATGQHHFEWIFGTDFILRNTRRTAGPVKCCVRLTPWSRNHR